eukprot:7224433-Prymnesium_polylepis.1
MSMRGLIGSRRVWGTFTATRTAVVHGCLFRLARDAHTLWKQTNDRRSTMDEKGDRFDRFVGSGSRFARASG